MMARRVPVASSTSWRGVMRSPAAASAATPAGADHPGAPRLAYVLKAYPRASEPFILSEIHRLEELGIPLRLFATKPAEPQDRVPRHPVIDRIHASPEYLSPTTSTSGVPLRIWLGAHWPLFAGSLRRVVRRHPVGVVRALGRLGIELVRSGIQQHVVKRAYIREFFHAVELVDRLGVNGSVRHLHAHYAHGATTVAWFAAQMAGLSFSFTGHAKDLYNTSANPAGVLRRKLSSARFALTCTEANQRMLQALLPASTVHCVYHGLNADFADLLVHRQPPPREHRHFRVLSVGRLVRKKGFDILIEAVGRLVAEGTPIEVNLIGNEGDHGPAIRALIRDRGLGSVVSLSGPREQRELYDEYHRAHVFCLPCRVLEDGDRDGIPNVIMEAMACGTPVLTTSVSGIPEMVRDGWNGLLVPPDDVDALAAALRRAIANPAWLRTLGDGARGTASDRFDGDRLAARLAGLLLEAVA